MSIENEELSFIPAKIVKQNAMNNKLKARTAEAAIRKFVPEQLQFWPDDRRAIANELARSALFQCRNDKEPREYLDNVELFVLGEGAMTYKGEELRTRDEDLFVTFAHCARDMPSGKMIVRITSSEICRMNGWRQAQPYYKIIFESIQRMKGGVITVFSKRLAKALKCQRALDAGASEEELAKLYDELESFECAEKSLLTMAEKSEEVGGIMVSLISGDPTFTGSSGIKDGIPQGNLSWELTLDKKLVSLFAQPYRTLVDFETRKELSGTGKRLQAYYLSHKKPHDVKLRSLEKMLGRQNQSLAALKFQITAELRVLQEKGDIFEFSFKKSADGTDWLVSVVRERPEPKKDSPK